MRFRSLAIALGCASAELGLPSRVIAQRAPTTVVLAGHVVDANDRAVAYANVSIEGLVTAVADSGGRFAFAGLESETLLLRVHCLGYVETTRVVVFSADSSQHVVIRLVSRTAVLPGVTVLDSVDDDPRGYARRRRDGQGFFLTRQDIKDRGPTSRVEHILATIPGLTVEAGIVKVRRGRLSIYGNNCEGGVQYFLEGAMLGPAFTPRLLTPEMLTGIEVYKTAASTPPEYRTMQTSCGTVVIWTR
jgi:hypothetical protein